MARNELPLLAALAERGSLNLECVSVFPSITPAATASIITGRYPGHHGVTGMSWWNPSTDDVSYFGDDVWTILQRGVNDFLRRFLLQLNGQRLKAPTLFQLVEREQRRAACFNYLIFRGDVPHEVTLPLLLSLVPSVDRRMTVHGPSWLCLGDFVSATGRRDDVTATGGVLNRFGLDDQGTEDFLKSIPDPQVLPDFSVAYFANYDFDSHELGPEGALDTLRQVDARLRTVIDTWGGLDRVLDDLSIVLTADHCHSDITTGDDVAIVLDDVLDGYPIAGPGDGDSGRELLVCPNLRAAELYMHDSTAESASALSDALLQDARIDQVIWRESHDAPRFHVTTRDRGRLEFRPASEGAGVSEDEYGGRWEMRGDLDAIDASIQAGRVRYGMYPNALERVANGLDHPRRGRLWVTARPGYEFRMPGQRVHRRGGSHGTLHALDSHVPLLIAGGHARQGLEPAVTPRIVDVAAICLELLGMRDVAPVDEGARHR